MEKERFLPLLAAIIYSTIFGLSFMFSKMALEVIRPIELIAFRFLLAAIILTILKGLGLIRVDLKGRKIKILLVTAILQPVLYFIFEVLGVSMSTSSEAGMIVALIPIISAVLGFIFLKESLKAKQLVFILLSIMGVIFINVMKAPVELGKSYMGLIFLLLAAISGSLYNISSRTASKNFEPIETTYVMMWTGAIVFNSISIITSIVRGDIRNYFNPLFNLDALIPIFYLGILSSIIAFFLLNYALAKLPVFQATVFNNISTLVAILAGVFILKENFTLFDMIGAAMIISGVWGTVYFGKEPKKNNFQNKPIVGGKST